jgi:hypothetical protein
MIQKEKESRQTEVALMLGWKPHENSELCFVNENHPFDVLSIDDFDSEDWNWIMKVVKKILSIVSENDDMETYNIIIDQIPDIEAVFIAISDFAKKYNNNKK